MHLRLDGKTALVTGGTKGIGLGCALALAGAGARVAVNYNSDEAGAGEALASLQAVAGADRVMAVRADVADEDRVGAMLGAVTERFGPVDVLISNAAWSARPTFLTADTATLRRTMDVTFYGHFHVCHAVATAMVARRAEGSIVVVGSIHGIYPLPAAFDYNVAKAAAHHMAMTMANELAPHRIRVNLLVPGWIDTPGERKWMSDEALQREGGKLPWGRLGTPEEIGKVALFLASDAAAYVSGSTYTVDGALTVTMPSGGTSESRYEP